MLKDDYMVDYYSYVKDIGKIPKHAGVFRKALSFATNYGDPTNIYYLYRSYLLYLENDNYKRKYDVDEEHFIVYCGDLISLDYMALLPEDYELDYI